MNDLRFKDFFPYDKELYQIVILFFDNMIRRDYINTLREMKARRSGMLCDNIGYNLPDADDCDFIKGDHIELWWTAGANEHSYDCNYNMFVECLKLSADIWKKNNSINDIQVIKEINDSIGVIESRYIHI